jgi:GR25 family glycosyltransferase involved in LPS biosynthesis
MLNLKYSIISIDDRAIDNTSNTRKLMKNFEEIHIDCINGNKQDVKKMLSEYNMSLLNWNWHSSPRGGELGLWLSNINLFKKMIDENIENVLLFEDDAIVTYKINDAIDNAFNEMPEDYDFMSFVFPSSSKHLYKDDANIGLKTICSAKYNHFGTYAVLWSNSGAKNMLKILNEIGITCPIDIYMYDFLLKENLINGYSLRPDQEQVVFHGHNKYGSVIDLDGRRGMLDV